eukprot:TRINITY_DN16948_c0_g1_i1.p1 TRINITY_DN16948_c0_g1~~TRINITY_DN16948_c0_g1_i1.p1  ORF type:complete len:267 (+),score=70.48 TRINITY_DN16948_c0_g1_i1:119-919(+)
MSAAKESGPLPADGEDERVLALLQGLSDKLGAVEQEILTDASGRTTRRVKDKVVVSNKGEARNLQDEMHSLRRRRNENPRKGPRSKLRFCIQASVLLLLLLGGYLYLRSQTRPFDISRWREGNEAFPGLHWFDRSSFEQGGKGTGSRREGNEGVADVAESALGGAVEAVKEAGTEDAADGAVQVGLADTEGAGMDEQQSQLRKKVSDAKSLLSDEAGAAKDALESSKLGTAIKEKVVQLEQEEAEEVNGEGSGGGGSVVVGRKSGR